MSITVLVESTSCQMAPKKMYLVQLWPSHTIPIICFEDTGIYLLLLPIHNPYQSCCFFCINSATLSVVQICKLGEPAGWSFVTAVKKSDPCPRETETKSSSMNGTRALCRYSNYISFLILCWTVFLPEFTSQWAQIISHDHTYHLECSDKYLLLRVYHCQQSINVLHSQPRQFLSSSGCGCWFWGGAKGHIVYFVAAPNGTLEPSKGTVPFGKSLARTLVSKCISKYKIWNCITLW